MQELRVEHALQAAGVDALSPVVEVLGDIVYPPGSLLDFRPERDEQRAERVPGRQGRLAEIRHGRGADLLDHGPVAGDRRRALHEVALKLLDDRGETAALLRRREEPGADQPGADSHGAEQRAEGDYPGADGRDHCRDLRGFPLQRTGDAPQETGPGRVPFLLGVLRSPVEDAPGRGADRGAFPLHPDRGALGEPGCRVLAGLLHVLGGVRVHVGIELNRRRPGRLAELGKVRERLRHLLLELVQRGPGRREPHLHAGHRLGRQRARLFQRPEVGPELGELLIEVVQVGHRGEDVRHAQVIHLGDERGVIGIRLVEGFIQAGVRGSETSRRDAFRPGSSARARARFAFLAEAAEQRLAAFLAHLPDLVLEHGDERRVGAGSQQPDTARGRDLRLEAGQQPGIHVAEQPLAEFRAAARAAAADAGFELERGVERLGRLGAFRRRLGLDPFPVRLVGGLDGDRDEVRHPARLLPSVSMFSSRMIPASSASAWLGRHPNRSQTARISSASASSRGFSTGVPIRETAPGRSRQSRRSRSRLLGRP